MSWRMTLYRHKTPVWSVTAPTLDKVYEALLAAPEFDHQKLYYMECDT